MACIGAGLVLAFQTIQVYIVDSFTLYTASGTRPLTWLDMYSKSKL